MKRRRRYAPLPPGSYTCVASSVQKERTRSGDEMWRIKFVVTEGAHRSRRIYDRLVFSERAKPFLRHKLEALGIACNGWIELYPHMIEGRRVLLRTTINERGFADVAPGGYSPAPRHSRPHNVDTGDLGEAPF